MRIPISIDVDSLMSRLCYIQQFCIRLHKVGDSGIVCGSFYTCVRAKSIIRIVWMQLLLIIFYSFPFPNSSANTFLPLPR